MRIWNGLDAIREPFEQSSVAIGMFDGLHVGHLALIADCVADARTNRRPAIVFTFDRHPAELISPDRVPGYLTTASQREDILGSIGVDDLVVARFDDRLRNLSPECYLRFVVKGILGAKSVFVGHDFRFGRDHEGHVDYLRDSRERLDLELHVLDPVTVDGERAASRRIRELLRSGDLDKALRMLGHPYRLAGRVVEGRKLGRELGFPTANIELARAQVLPADGIYAVWAIRGGECYKGACSIGIRPTIGGTDRTLEVYLLGFDGDLYGESIDLEFVARLRDEQKFESLEALKAQIAEDVRRVESLLSS